MREIVHIQAGQCGNQIGSKVSFAFLKNYYSICRHLFNDDMLHHFLSDIFYQMYIFFYNSFIILNVSIYYTIYLI